MQMVRVWREVGHELLSTPGPSACMHWFVSLSTGKKRNSPQGGVFLALVVVSQPDVAGSLSLRSFSSYNRIRFFTVSIFILDELCHLTVSSFQQGAGRRSLAHSWLWHHAGHFPMLLPIVASRFGGSVNSDLRLLSGQCRWSSLCETVRGPSKFRVEKLHSRDQQSSYERERRV